MFQYIDEVTYLQGVIVTIPVHLFSIKSVTGITHSGLPRYPAMLSKTHSLSSAMLVTPSGVSY